ncbi:Breast cancer 2, early onset [Boothiomyces sp. JEL0838]|nr:Breast cancer 2, early onset [Boothiomyces sp. JEL0838]
MSKEFKQPLKTPQRELLWSPSMETPVQSSNDTPGTLMNRLRGEEPSPIFEIKKRKLGARLGAAGITSSRYEKFNRKRLSDDSKRDSTTNNQDQNLKSLDELHLSERVKPKRKLLQESGGLNVVPSLKDLELKKRSTKANSKNLDSRKMIKEGSEATRIISSSTPKLNKLIANELEKIEISPTVAKSLPVTPIISKTTDWRSSNTVSTCNLQSDIGMADGRSLTNSELNMELEKTAREVLSQMIDDEGSLTDIDVDTDTESVVLAIKPRDNPILTEHKEASSEKFNKVFMSVDTENMKSPFMIEPVNSTCDTEMSEILSKSTSTSLSERKSSVSYKFTSQVLIESPTFETKNVKKVNCVVDDQPPTVKSNEDDYNETSLSPVLCGNEFIANRPAAVEEIQSYMQPPDISQHDSSQTIEELSNVFLGNSQDDGGNTGIFSKKLISNELEESTSDPSLDHSSNITQSLPSIPNHSTTITNAAMDLSSSRANQKFTDNILIPGSEITFIPGKVYESVGDISESQYTSKDDLGLFYTMLNNPLGVNPHLNAEKQSLNLQEDSRRLQEEYEISSSPVLPHTEEEYADLGFSTQMLAKISLPADEQCQIEVEQDYDRYDSQFYANVSLTQISKRGDAVELIGITTGNGVPIQTSLVSKDIGEELFKLEEDLDMIETKPLNIKRSEIDSLYKPKILNERDFTNIKVRKEVIHTLAVENNKPESIATIQAFDTEVPLEVKEFCGFSTAAGKKLMPKLDSLKKAEQLFNQVQQQVASEFALVEASRMEKDKDPTITLFGNGGEADKMEYSQELFESQVVIVENSSPMKSKKSPSNVVLIDKSLEVKDGFTFDDNFKEKDSTKSRPTFGGFTTAGGKALAKPGKAAFEKLREIMKEDGNSLAEQKSATKDSVGYTCAVEGVAQNHIEYTGALDIPRTGGDPKNDGNLFVDNSDVHSNLDIKYLETGEVNTHFVNNPPEPTKESFLKTRLFDMDSDQEQDYLPSESSEYTPFNPKSNIRAVSEPSKIQNRKTKRNEDAIVSPRKRKSFGGFHAKLNFLSTDSPQANRIFGKSFQSDSYMTPVKAFKSPVILQPFSARKTPTTTSKSILRNTPFKKPAITPTAIRKSTPNVTPRKTFFDLKLLENRQPLKNVNLELPSIGMDMHNLPEWYHVNANNALMVKFNENGKLLGVQEAISELQSRGCIESVCKEQWAANHYRFIVWKLASMARMLNQSERWNFESVIEQLLYRYEIEVNQAKRSPLQAIVEGDAPANRHMVLLVSKLETTNGRLEVELSDGWYSVLADLDDCLFALTSFGKLFLGQKLHVQGAKMNSVDPCAILDAAISNRRLKICANSTRRALWHTSLGYQPNTFFPIKLSSILENGGMVTLVDVIVQRVYQTEHIERLADGSVIVRDQKEEEQEQYQWQELNRKAYNRAMQKYESGNIDFDIDERNSETIHQSLKEYANGMVPPRNVQISTTIKVIDFPPQLDEETLEQCTSAIISITGHSLGFEEEIQSSVGIKYQIELSCADETGTAVLQGQISQKRLDYIRTWNTCTIKKLTS